LLLLKQHILSQKLMTP